MHNPSIPAATIIPVLAYDDVPAASAWLCQHFGFQPRLHAGADHAQLTFGEGAIFLTKSRTGQGFAEVEDQSKIGQPRPNELSFYLLIRVPDVEAHYAQTLAAGLPIHQPPTTYPFGERQYTTEDFAGYRWTFTESVEAANPADWGGVMATG